MMDVTVNPEKILLENILLGFSMMRPFSKREAAHFVGSRKLQRLIEEGKIDVIRKGDAKCCTWYCNTVQVLKHCRNFRKGTKQKNNRYEGFFD